jgi:hypothetical protein
MSNTALVKNVYYNAFAYNSGIANIDSSQDSQLLYDLLPAGDSQNYQLAIAKLRTSLTAIPMSTTNIGLKQYQIILRNTFPSSGTNRVVEASAYVRQINSTTSNFVFSLSGTNLNSYTYTSTGISSVVRSVDLSGVCEYIYNYVIDDYLNVYIAGSNTNPNNADTLFICDGNITPNVLQTIVYNNLTSLYIDRNQKLYVADDGVGNGTVFVYFNQNGENTVTLTPQGTIRTSFTSLEITNIAFAVATDTTIIVGHDTNVITYYNQQLNPIAQYIEEDAHQFKTANVLNSNNTLVISDTSQYADTLYGTLASAAVANIETNTTLTATTAYSAMACTNSGYGYVVGSDGYTYYQSLPITPIGAFISADSTTSISQTVANKNGLYAIGVGANPDFSIYLLNAGQYFTCNTDFQIGANQIISMDYNVNTDIAIAVDSAHNLWQSNIPILPYNFMVWSNNLTVSTYGASPNASSGSILSRNIRNTPFSSGVYGIAQWGAYTYTIEGAIGSQVVVQRSFTDYAFTSTGTSYNLVETAGHIKQICVFNTFLCVYDGTNVLRIYTLGTNTQLHNSGTTYADTALFSMCSLDNNDNLLIGADTILGVANISAFIPVGNIYTSPLPILNVAVNSGDITNGTYATFTNLQTALGVGKVNKQVWNAGYAGVASNTLILQLNNNIFNIACNPYQGLLYAFPENAGVLNGIAEVYAQFDGYQLLYEINYDLSAEVASAGIYLPNNASNPYAWTQQTSNIPLKSVAVSRNNSNTLYGISNTNSTTYSGTLTNNAITFNQLTTFQAQTYNHISTTINSAGNINTTLRTYTINNQQPLATTTILNENIASIARNEQDRQYIVPLKATNQIANYNDALIQQYKNTLTSPFAIFAKNGADIDAGPYSIYDLSLVIAAINVAFQDAYTSIKAQGGNLAEAPFLTLDINGLLTINYSTDYTSTGNGILFNNPLEQLCYFTATSDTIDVGFFNLFLAPSTTTTTQLNKSMYIFNQLDKIQIASQSLFVNGQYFGINSFSQVITDIDVPIDQFPNGNVGQILYYQPNFLRVFQLTSGGNPVNRIQLSIYYAYRNGTTAVVPLVPGESFSTTIQFVKKF